jgi:uncharacterized protein YbcI
MAETPLEERTASLGVLTAVSNVLVALHKEQFGRGATRARTEYAGPDAMVCVLEDVLLPAERKLVSMGQDDRVRDQRNAFQNATADEFITAVEKIVHRKVRAFASSVDTHSNVVFENFVFVSRDGELPPAAV